ncbi:MAG: hypothetical protein RLZZ511_3172 [Cyanobacteriota bacterium]
MLTVACGGAPQAIAADAPSTMPVITESRVYGEEKLVGIVRQVAGNQIVMQLENGTERSVNLPDDSIVGDMRFLVGQRIVLTDTNCTPPPAPVAIDPPHTPSQMVIPQRW